jgi:hypothetical protein
VLSRLELPGGVCDDCREELEAARQADAEASRYEVEHEDVDRDWDLVNGGDD